MGASKKVVVDADDDLQAIERLILKPGSPTTVRRGRGGGAKSAPRTPKKQKTKEVIQISDGEEGANPKLNENVHVPLDPDDSMFKRPSGANRMDRLDSPLQTRSASGIVKKRKLPDADDGEIFEDKEVVNEKQSPVSRSRKKPSKKAKNSVSETKTDAERLAAIERLLVLHRALKDKIDAADDAEDGSDQDVDENEYDLDDPFIDDSEAPNRPAVKHQALKDNPFIDNIAVDDDIAEDDDIVAKSTTLKGKKRQIISPDWDLDRFEDVTNPMEEDQKSLTLGEKEEAKQLQLAIRASLETGQNGGVDAASSSQQTLDEPSSLATLPVDQDIGTLTSLPGLSSEVIEILLRAFQTQGNTQNQSIQDKIAALFSNQANVDTSVMMHNSLVSSVVPGNGPPVAPTQQAPSKVVSMIPTTVSGIQGNAHQQVIPQPPTTELVVKTPASRANPRVTPTVTPAPAQAPAPSQGRRTFGQVAPAGTAPVTKTAPFRQMNVYRVQTLPDKCEVFNPSLQDPLLASEYIDLPNLKFGTFVPWTDTAGPGQVFASSYGDLIPDMDFELFHGAVGFVICGHFIGPGRASPLLTNAVRTTADGFRMTLQIENRPAILISTIYVKSCHLTQPYTSGIRRKFIAGIGHCQEWERQVSFLCMGFGYDTLHAQLAADSLSYTTKGMPKGSNDSELDRRHFSPKKSPAIKFTKDTTRKNYSTAEGIALECGDEVPIYDARHSHDFNIKTDLGNVDAILPRFNGEVPMGSCAVVAYTANVYRSNVYHNWQISCNIQFVIVLGVPSSILDD